MKHTFKTKRAKQFRKATADRSAPSRGLLRAGTCVTTLAGAGELRCGLRGKRLTAGGPQETSDSSVVAAGQGDMIL